MLDISKIVPDEMQARKYFDKDSLISLAESIKQHGIIHPITVIKINNEDTYKIVAGERRFRAAQIAGLDKIPTIVGQYDKSHRKVVALVENLQREDLNPIELAEGLLNLKEEFNLKDEYIGEAIGRARSTITNLLRILTLSSHTKKLIRQGNLELGHAKILLGIDASLENEIATYIVENSLTVRETQELVDKHKNFKPNVGLSDNNFSDKEQKIHTWNEILEKKIPYKIKINMNKKGQGTLVIKFDSLENADRLIRNIRID